MWSSTCMGGPDHSLESILVPNSFVFWLSFPIGLSKLEKVITQGAFSPWEPLPGREMALGEYCGNSLRIRSMVASMPPGPTAGGVSGGRTHARRFLSQASQLTAQDVTAACRAHLKALGFDGASVAAVTALGPASLPPSPDPPLGHLFP